MNKTRLLIVEDETIVVADLESRLPQLGYQVAATAASGEQALTLAEQVQPDLVLMDIHLRGAMDGIETAREMRARLRLPVVFLTAYAESATLQRAKVAEPFGYILKPFEDRDLETALELALYKHQSERQLQEREERHQAILQTAMDGFCLMDPAGRLLEVNEAYCRMSGYSMPELLSMRIADLESDETPAETAAHLQKIMTRGEDRFDSRHRRKDGSVFDVEVSVQHRPAKDGWFVAFVQDITERKRAETALKANLEALRQALDQIKTLRGIVPICASCKKIRDDQGFWNQVEAYISRHSEVRFSHGLCPECMETLFPGLGPDGTENK